MSQHPLEPSSADPADASERPSTPEEPGAYARHVEAGQHRTPVEPVPPQGQPAYAPGVLDGGPHPDGGGATGDARAEGAAASATPAPPRAAPTVIRTAAPSAAYSSWPAPSEAPAEPEVRRFMTATDFLERRADSIEDGPATWGWRGAVRRLSGGLVTPRMGPAELTHERHRAGIQRAFDGPRTIAFINPKGGAAKTTSVLAAGFTFGTVRGGGVVAWDNNETRGTLGIRGARSTHRNTTRELIEDLATFSDVHRARIGDLGAFVRSQGDAHFDVLASDERPDVTGMIRADDFREVHRLLERFYRIILVDTGNNMRAENWLAAAEAADLLVVTSTIREDTGYSGLWMLDALQESGYPDLKHRTVTVLADPSGHVDGELARDLVEVYQQRTRDVFRVPYDPSLVAGSVVPYRRLSRETRAAWLRACAGMAAAL